ncbi:UNVERIFIED_CONTAM: hypothetical protein GTU68_011852 [Idotea baltica]|nr:hypothetical protein [Idotea baltica]
MGAKKSLLMKKRLAKKQRQNRPLPNWFRYRPDSKYQIYAKRDIGEELNLRCIDQCFKHLFKSFHCTLHIYLLNYQHTSNTYDNSKSFNDENHNILLFFIQEKNIK